MDMWVMRCRDVLGSVVQLCRATRGANQGNAIGLSKVGHTCIHSNA